MFTWHYVIKQEQVRTKKMGRKSRYQTLEMYANDSRQNEDNEDDHKKHKKEKGIEDEVNKVMEVNSFIYNTKISGFASSWEIEQREGYNSHN